MLGFWVILLISMVLARGFLVFCFLWGLFMSYITNIHWNCRDLGIKSYFLQCSFFAQTDVLVLRETFLKVDKLFFIPGKIIYRLGRRDGLSGVLIAVNSSFLSTRMDISVGNANAEIMGIKITLDLFHLKIINV